MLHVILCIIYINFNKCVNSFNSLIYIFLFLFLFHIFLLLLFFLLFLNLFLLLLLFLLFLFPFLPLFLFFLFLSIFFVHFFSRWFFSPVVSEAQYLKIWDYIDEAKDLGSRFLYGGERDMVTVGSGNVARNQVLYFLC